MIDELRTDRLLLTPLTLDHVDAYYRVYGDPRTWEHLPSGRHTSRGESARAIERSMQSRRTYGFGHCAVVLREPVGDLAPGTFLGSAGAAMLAFDAWNLGYRLAPEAWGHGLAGEAARVSLEAARAGVPRPRSPPACWRPTRPRCGCSSGWSSTSSGAGHRATNHRAPTTRRISSG